MKFDQKCYLQHKFTEVIVYNQVLERVGVIVELSSEMKAIIFAFFFVLFCMFFCHGKDGCSYFWLSYKSSHYSH